MKNRLAAFCPSDRLIRLQNIIVFAAIILHSELLMAIGLTIWVTLIVSLVRKDMQVYRRFDVLTFINSCVGIGIIVLLVYSAIQTFR